MEIQAFPGVRQFIAWVVNNEPAIVQGVINMIGALLILVSGIFISRVVSSGFMRVMLTRNVDQTITQFCSALLRYALLAFAVIAALGRVGVETSSIIAVVGAAGLAIGLALQGSLANFAAGVLLVTLRPIRAGEYASVGAVAGTIEEVHIFSTTLRTADNKVVVVPNGKIIASEITNYSRQKERRVDITLGVACSTSVEHLKDVIKAVVLLDPRILHAKGHTIRLSEFAPSSLNFVVRVWAENAHYWDVYYDLMENIKNALDTNQISLAYPQMGVHLHALSGAINPPINGTHNNGTTSLTETTLV